MGEYLLIAATGLLGSSHCVGMCGPIVWAYAARLPAEAGWPLRLANHLAYNIGRVGMWTFLGFGLGMAGQVAGVLAPMGRVLALAGGVGMVALGLANLGLLPLRFRFEGEGGGTLWRGFRRVFQGLIGAGGVSGRFALGLTNGLLPCGLSYAFLARAAATGSPGEGALVMIAFGAGTVPALLGAGVLLGRLRLPRWSERLAAAAVLSMGLLLLWRGSGNIGAAEHQHLPDTLPRVPEFQHQHRGH